MFLYSAKINLSIKIFINIVMHLFHSLANIFNIYYSPIAQSQLSKIATVFESHFKSGRRGRKSGRIFARVNSRGKGGLGRGWGGWGPRESGCAFPRIRPTAINSSGSQVGGLARTCIICTHARMHMYTYIYILTRALSVGKPDSVRAVGQV